MKLRHASLAIAAVLAAALIWQIGKPGSPNAPSAPATDSPAAANEGRLYEQARGIDASIASVTTQTALAQPTPVNAPRSTTIVSSASTVTEYEQQFYAGNNLRLDKLMAATETESFAEMFHALESAEIDPALRQRSQLLNDKLHSLPELQSGTISLQRFACGSRFCAAAFFSQDDAAWTPFQNSLSSQLGLPEGGVSFVGLSGEQGNQEQRLVFSIDGNVTTGLVIEKNSGIRFEPAAE